MSTYKAGLVPEDPQALADFLRTEFQRLEQALNEPQDFAALRVLYATPKRTFAGMVVYADGTTWNPGSGEGVYVRNAANAAWRYLG